MIGTSLTGRQKADITTAFSRVYDENVWQRKGTSGPGSSVQHTGEYRVYLQRLIASYKVKSILDVGCGLWEYMHHVNLNGIRYHGIDPVPSVIESNRKLGTPSSVTFQCGVLDDVLNLHEYDMAIVKDVLQHLPNALILRMLEQLKVVPFVVITNDLLSGPNVDCELGGFRKINLEGPPFSVQPAGKLDFQSVPFVKRTLVIRNDVSAVGQASSTSTSSASA
jgi:SAM-dependent methyltransferase